MNFLKFETDKEYVNPVVKLFSVIIIIIIISIALGKLGDFFFPSSSLQEITNVEYFFDREQYNAPVG